MSARDVDRGADLAALIAQTRLSGSEPHYDALTGLPGRSLFHAIVEQALLRRHEGLALLSLSVDDVVSLREEHGASTADTLLAAVSGRLRRSVRGGDVAARMRDFDFALLMAADDVAEAACAAQRLLDRLREPYEVSGALVRVAVSIGIAYAGPTEDNAAWLLERADIALERARASGRSEWKIFRSGTGIDPDMQDAMLADLHAALKNGEMSIAYQPVVSADGFALRSANAVLQWDHPKIGLIGSGDFLPVINDPHAARLLADWSIDEVCRDLGRLGIGVPMAVTLDWSIVADPLLERAVLEAITRERIDPSLFWLGIPHPTIAALATGGDAGPRAPAAAPDSPLHVLRRLRAAGVRILLTDYADTASSPALLRALPIDGLRTADSVLEELDSDIRAFVRVQGLTGMAASLKLECCAGGVATGEQLEQARRFGFTGLSGPILGEAMQATELAAHARSGRPILPPRLTEI